MVSDGPVTPLFTSEREAVTSERNVDSGPSIPREAATSVDVRPSIPRTSGERLSMPRTAAPDLFARNADVEAALVSRNEAAERASAAVERRNAFVEREKADAEMESVFVQRDKAVVERRNTIVEGGRADLERQGPDVERETAAVETAERPFAREGASDEDVCASPAEVCASPAEADTSAAQASVGHQNGRDQGRDAGRDMYASALEPFSPAESVAPKWAKSDETKPATTGRNFICNHL